MYVNACPCMNMYLGARIQLLAAGGEEQRTAVQSPAFGYCLCLVLAAIFGGADQ